MADLLISVAVLLFAYMSSWFVVASLKKRLDVVDTAWGIGFIVVAWFAEIWQPSGRSLLVAILVSIWGMRLARHTYLRSKKRGHEDPRYDTLSAKWSDKFGLRAFLSVFMLQGAMVWVISLPIVLTTGDRLGAADWFVWLGALGWLKGFIIEAIADRQLQQFVSNPKNKGKVMDRGLWGYSRHPNYYGEIVQWLSIGIIACSARGGWVGFIGPLLLASSIIFVSGIPPIENRKKSDPAYRAYMQRVSPLVPWFRH